MGSSASKMGVNSSQSRPLEELFLTWTAEVWTGPLVAADAVCVADVVGRHEPSELREELALEGVVATEALRLGDEVEQPLRIARRECLHGTQTIGRGRRGWKRVDAREHTDGDRCRSEWNCSEAAGACRHSRQKLQNGPGAASSVRKAPPTGAKMTLTSCAG